MATYVIGDIHGCMDTLKRLLGRIGFDVRLDRLWQVGDLVNRGPDSLDVLRWARGLGDRLVSILGNHDLHLIARSGGCVPSRPGDTLDPVLAAADAPELIEWLIQRPLMHEEDGFVMVHAGLLPQWSLNQAFQLARRTEERLRCPESRDAILRELSGRPQLDWSPELKGVAADASVLRVLTRIRTCTEEGRMCTGFAGPPEEAPEGCLPWFRFPRRKNENLPLLFGHWAAMGYRREGTAFCLDSACVWGLSLSALRLEDERLFQVPR